MLMGRKTCLRRQLLTCLSPKEPRLKPQVFGKPRIVLAYDIVKLAVMLAATIYGAHFGIVGLTLVYVPLQLVEIPDALLLADRMLRVSPSEVWRAARIPIGVG